METMSEKAFEILESKYFGTIIAGEEENIISQALNLLWEYETGKVTANERKEMDEAYRYWLCDHKKESERYDKNWGEKQRKDQNYKVHMIARAVRACSWLAQEENKE